MTDTGTRRLTANITPETAQALQLVADREGVPVTEALRRLVRYGALLYRTTQVDGSTVQIVRADGVERVLLI